MLIGPSLLVCKILRTRRSDLPCRVPIKKRNFLNYFNKVANYHMKLVLFTGTTQEMGLLNLVDLMIITAQIFTSKVLKYLLTENFERIILNIV